MRGLDDVFRDALEDEFGANLDTKTSEARLVFGVKIQRDKESGDVEILNTTKGGDYYEEISLDEYKNFFKKGWRYGVYLVSLSNYRRKLDLIESKIADLILAKSSQGNITHLQNRRTKIMQRYTQISKKLNLLN